MRSLTKWDIENLTRTWSDTTGKSAAHRSIRFSHPADADLSSATQYSEAILTFVLVAIDILGSLVGIVFMNADSVRGWAMSLSSGILLAIALLWMFPEMSNASGPFLAGTILLAALGLLLAFDRYVYPVCPCCSHSSGRRKGAEQPEMLWPMLAGIAIHNVFDGWTAAVATQTPGRAGIGLLAGVLIHKLPESVILGLLLRSATRRNRDAFLWSVATSIFLLVGALPSQISQSFQGGMALLVSLTFGAASFLFIGIHTFRSECSRRGPRFAISTLLAGFACAAAVQVALGFA